MSIVMAEDTVETPALGRPFQLGMLYDCRKDLLIPGVTLWDRNSLQKDVIIEPQPKTESEIIASDSIDDKASALDISAPLKASFLGGLVEVGGSAKYLQDTRKSKKQARVTLHYKTTTKYEHLTMSQLGIMNVSYPAVFEQGTATHVVTAILYGAQAFFVFDREVSSTETVKDIQGSLQDTIKKLISIKGEADTKLNEEEKENVLKFNCKFYGDFSLDTNPVTFQDAMQVYTTLPKMLGKDGEKAVPVRVWLYPLSKLDPRAAKMVREISLMLISDAEKILEERSEIEMQSNDPDVDNPGASIYLYEDGELVSKNFELPSKPLPLLISKRRHDSIRLKFQPAEYGKATISSYLVWYKDVGEENWKSEWVEGTRKTFLLKNLAPNTEYQFKYTACCELGLIKNSDLRPPIKTLPTSPPEKLRIIEATSSTISVDWKSPSIVASGVEVKEYRVEYRMVEADIEKYPWSEVKTRHLRYQLEGLTSQTAYRIRVSAVCNNGVPSVPSEEVTISTSLRL